MSKTVFVSDLFVSSNEFFHTHVEEALEKRNIATFPLAAKYLVDLLSFYIHSSNLFEQESKMLAEMFLESTSLTPTQKKEKLKKLGDSSLYIGGFFGDSLKKKIIDIDYYIEMGETAYSQLASVERDQLKSKVYEEYASKFCKFVDVLTYISQKWMVQTNADLLRLYDRYLNTGSDLARDQLIERGLLNAEVGKKSNTKN